MIQCLEGVEVVGAQPFPAPFSLFNCCAAIIIYLVKSELSGKCSKINLKECSDSSSGSISMREQHTCPKSIRAHYKLPTELF